MDFLVIILHLIGICRPSRRPSLEARQFLSQSSVCLSNEPKGSIDPKESRSNGATNVGGKEATDEDIDMKDVDASSTPPPKSATACLQSQIDHTQMPMQVMDGFSDGF